MWSAAAPALEHWASKSCLVSLEPQTGQRRVWVTLALGSEASATCDHAKALA